MEQDQNKDEQLQYHSCLLQNSLWHAIRRNNYLHSHCISFIKSFSINISKQQPFPFNIPAVRFAKNIELDKVTIFVGDNGSGKSTLLETIAYAVNLPLISGFIGSVADFEAARILKESLRLDWRRNTSMGFFFRAEDFSAFGRTRRFDL